MRQKILAEYSKVDRGNMTDLLPNILHHWNDGQMSHFQNRRMHSDMLSTTSHSVSCLKKALHQCLWFFLNVSLAADGLSSFMRLNISSRSPIEVALHVD